MKRISLAALLAAIPTMASQDAATAPATVAFEISEKATSNEARGKIKIKPMIEVACCTVGQLDTDPLDLDPREFIR